MSNNIQNIIKYPKSSFYWGMKILDEEKKNAMFAIYAFCKKADSIADSHELKKKKIKKINELRKEINKIFNNNLNNKSSRTLEYYIDSYKLKKKYFLEIINGVEMDINNIMICPNKKIFNLYCYRVAGAVGLISLKIFGCYNKKTKYFGLYLAKALQITNRVEINDVSLDEYGWNITIGKLLVTKDTKKNTIVYTLNELKMVRKGKEITYHITIPEIVLVEELK